ncbi:MAG: glycosyltransferase family 4 protein [Alphaproteobacteria bacterium]
MNPAIYYDTDAYDTSGSKLMGRHAAGEGFLRGYARHSGADQFLCYTRSEKGFADFRERLARLAGGPRPCRWIPHGRSTDLGEAGCLYFPAPNLGGLAWQRRYLEPKLYSLCGVTHTTASAGVMDALGELVLAPLESWDAVICTSRAVRATIERVHETWGDYLAQRFGGQPRCPAQLPVIPLGVDCDHFAPSASAKAARAKLRKKHRIADNDVAVLFVGRFSYHAKAHPMPMYLGLEEAARRTGKRIHLIQAGWFPNEMIERTFVDGARAFCPSVNALFLDGRDKEIRNDVWFAADVFVSLADNIQETFGLTPVEAMAAGLPVVVSDWDGYRDTVRPGIDGFAVPTVMPPSGAGDGLAYRHYLGLDSYDRYIGYTSQCVAVDVRASAEAFTALVGDAALRGRMGEQGRARARETFDWRVVIAAYQQLWRELAERRSRDSELAPRKPGAPIFPLRDDPFALFASYPTLALTDDLIVRAAVEDAAAELDRVKSIDMNDYASHLLATKPEILAVLERLAAEGPLAVGDFTRGTAGRQKALVQRSLAWLAKMGLVTIGKG